MKKENYKIFNLGNVKLLSGKTLKSAKLVYKVYGTLNSNKDNVILLPTFYTGTHKRNEGFFGRKRAINPNTHFIISINMFGNGLSSSPSNSVSSQKGSNFPLITLWDNIFCQHRLLTEEFKISTIALIVGWSMAGCQAYQWASQFPEMVKAIIPFCSSAKTSPHNFVFLEGIKAALCSDQNWNKGNYQKKPIRGLKAFARVYAGWAFSQTFYRDELFKKIGYNSIEELLIDWEKDHVDNWDANNLLTKLATWQAGDISVGPLYNNNYKKALKSIKAKTIIIPCTQDLYFRPEDNFIEARYIPDSEIYPYDSPYGHCVGNPGNDSNFEVELDKHIIKLLN
jgi:homoserine O-acetyltransferase